MDHYPAPYKMVLGTTAVLMLRMAINRLIVAISTTAFSSSPGLMDTIQCPHNAAGGVPCQRRSIDDTAQNTSVLH